MSILAAAIAVLAAAGALVPPILIRRSRDRLAAGILARGGAVPALLTPADRCIGMFRRVPGVLGLAGETVFFESRHEERREFALGAVRLASTGNRMTTTGRRLLRSEVVTLVGSDGTVSEFLMPKASVYQWRQHLGAWAAKQKTAADVVRPGR
jgi:hypothetical protein